MGTGRPSKSISDRRVPLDWEPIRERLIAHHGSLAKLANLTGIPKSTLFPTLYGHRVLAGAERVRKFVYACREAGVDPQPILRAWADTGSTRTRMAIDRAALPPEDPTEELMAQRQLLSNEARKRWRITGQLWPAPMTAADVFHPRWWDEKCDELIRQIESGQMAAVIAEVGVGKTTLYRCVREELARNDTILLIEMAQPDRRILTASQFEAALINHFLGDVKYFGYPAEKRARMVQDALISANNDGARVVLVVDEAHDLPEAGLHAIKRLRETVRYALPLFGVLLLAQTELHAKLEGHAMREVAQRLEVLGLPGLSKREVSDYVRYGFRRESEESLEASLPKAALETVAERLTAWGKAAERTVTPLMAQNLVCALLNQAARDGLPSVLPELVRELTNDAQRLRRSA